MSVKPYSRASSAELTERWFHRARLSSAARAATARPMKRGDSDAANPAGGGGQPVGPVRLQRVAPVGFGDVVVVEHHLRAQPAWGDGDGGRAVGRQFVALGERQTIHGDLHQVVEHRDSVPRRVVLGGPVGHLDEQPTWLVDQQGQEKVRGDQVGVDTEVEHPQALAEIVPPDRGVPFGGSTFQLLGTQMSLMSTSMGP
jgi:hypothetical protein